MLTSSQPPTAQIPERKAHRLCILGIQRLRVPAQAALHADGGYLVHEIQQERRHEIAQSRHVGVGEVQRHV